MVALDWLHAALLGLAVLAPSLYSRFFGSPAQDALSKYPILQFLVKVLAERAQLSPQEHSVVMQQVGESHPDIPPQVLALQVPAGVVPAEKK